MHPCNWMEGMNSASASIVTNYFVEKTRGKKKEKEKNSAGDWYEYDCDYWKKSFGPRNKM